MADNEDTNNEPNAERLASTSEAKEPQEEVELAVTNGTNGNGDTNDIPKDNDNEDDKGSDDEDNKVEEKPMDQGIISDAKDKLHDIEDKYRDKKYSRGECLCFFTFLIIFTIMAVLARGASDIAFTQTITMRQSLIERDEFTPWNDVGEKTFADASTIEDIYRYLEGVAIPFLMDPNSDYYVQSQQALLGGVRLKQLRVEETECDKDGFTRCWDNGKFDKGTVTWGNYTLTYIDSSDIDDQSWRGKYGSYPGGGFIVDLPLDYQTAMQNISNLRDISWMDGATRFLAADFNTYNPSTGLHTVARIAWEMPTGGVFPNDEIKTWKFERYNGGDGQALAAFHVLFLIWVLGTSIMEFTACFKTGCLKCGKGSYWNSKWKGLDAINLFIFYISIILFIYNESYRTSGIDIFNTDQYVSFRQLQYGFTLESYTIALNGALLWIKLFKYLAINKRLRFLFTMLGKSSTDILMFAIVLLVFIIAFGTAGFLTFNSDVDDFRSYVFSMGNMVRFTLVDMDYGDLTLSARLWGSMFYFLWSLLMFLILANVFIAILTEAYSQVQMELTDEDKLDLAFLGMGGVIGRVRQTIVERINQAVKHDEFDGDGDGKVSAEELAEQTNITIERAREIIAEHDVDGDGELDAEEFEKLKQQIINEQVEMEQARAITMRATHSPSLRADNVEDLTGAYGLTANISSKEFEDLKSEVSDIMELLTAVLDQTPAGKRALKQRELEKQREEKAERRRSSAKRSSKVGK